MKLNRVYGFLERQYGVHLGVTDKYTLMSNLTRQNLGFKVKEGYVDFPEIIVEFAEASLINLGYTTKKVLERHRNE